MRAWLKSYARPRGTSASARSQRVFSPRTRARRRGAGPREPPDGRVAPKELTVLRDHAVHLGLLEHDLGDEHAIGLARPSPGEIAVVVGVPREQATLEAAHQRRGRKLHGAECSTRV